MENNTQVSPVDTVVEKLSTAVAIAKIKFPVIQKRCEAAVLALSKFQEIKDDATDALAEKVLVKAREIYEESKAARMEFTGPMDDFKEIAMAPEKQINTDAKAPNSQYNRVRDLRNAFAQWKLENAAAEQKKIDDKRKHDEELNRIKIEFDRKAYGVVTDIVLNIDNIMEAFFKATTYETFEKRAEILKSQQPKLKQEDYDKIFTIPFNNQLITIDEFAAAQVEARSLFPYEKVNQDYVDRAKPKLQQWVEKLPAKQKALQELKDLADKQASEKELVEAKRKQEEKEAADALLLKQQSQAAAEEAIAAKNETLVTQEQEMNTQVMFAAQIATQSLSAPEGKVKKEATIISQEEDLVVTISELFYKVFIHPKYSGIVKRDKGGALKYDDSGRPVYEDWLEKLLDFYANNCEPTIKGISLKDKISTVQKKEK